MTVVKVLGIVQTAMRKCAVVLGAGGHAASAWEIGFIAGMADSAIDLRDAALLVGTSAGARVAVQLSSGVALEGLIQRQSDPKLLMSEAPQGVDWRKWRAEIERAKQAGGCPSEILRRIGSLVSHEAQESASDRRQFIVSQLPLQTWPKTRLSIVAVEVETGERRVFDVTSGIELVDAVMASGALPGIWPPVTYRSRRYIDGGLYSNDNADVAVGLDRVLIVTLRPGKSPLSVVSLDAGVEALRKSAARVAVVHPDEATEGVLASLGGNVLDPSVREPMLRSGRAQGRRAAGDLAMWFSHK